MALIDKLGRDANGQIVIAAHEWSAGLALYALGIANRSKIIVEFNLETSDEPQLDIILGTIDGLSADGKEKYHGRIEALNIFLEKGSITKVQYQGLVGF